MIELTAVATVLCVAALMASEGFAWRPGVWIAKPLASTGFILFALEQGSLGSTYGRLVTAALCLSWWGDVLLIPKSPRSFMLGIGAFLLGHVAYAGAFVTRGLSWGAVALSFAALLGPLALIGRALLPKVPAALKAPVMAYMVVISVMVAAAVGTVTVRFDGMLLLGALMFYGSDLSVARQRFAAPGFINRLWGLPMYYGAQLVLASTVAHVPSP